MSRKRLLIIDGDESFAREVAEVAGSRGFEAFTSASSVEGLELALSHQPDLIVVNVELAPTNGWSVCIKLKKNEALQHVPVVLTSSTSTADTFEKHRKLRTRADEYLLKPYEPNELVELAGNLVGLPDLSEPLVEIDESATFEDEYALEGADIITVGDDEPLEEVAFEDDDAAFAELGDEPDAGTGEDSEWGNDPLGEPLAAEAEEEEVIAFDEDVEPLEDPPAQEALEEFSRGEFATSEFSAGALAAATAALQQEAREQEALAADPLGDDAWGAEEIDPLAAFDDEASLEEVAVEEVAPEEAAFDDGFDDDFDALPALEDPAPEAQLNGASHDELAYDEAPLEVPEEAPEPTEDELIEELGSALDDGDFDLGDVDVNLGGESSAREGELEAELEGLRALEASREEELGRLRESLTARDQELFDLRTQLETRERELRDAGARHDAAASRANAEKTRRDATVKSLTARGEQLTLAVRKAERELTTLREQATRAETLEARVAELEAELETAREQSFEAESLREQLATAQAEVEGARTAQQDATSRLETALAEADGLRADLDEARHTAERALENAGTLQEKLAEANEKVDSALARIAELEKANSGARDTLLKMVEELGTA